jgi:hypothetical protein
MQLTNLQRVRKLGGDLMQRPSNIPRCVSQNILHRRSPIDLELPWFSYGAIDFLDNFLRTEMRVFELWSTIRGVTASCARPTARGESRFSRLPVRLAMV